MKNINGTLNCYFTHSIIADLTFILVGIFDKARKPSNLSEIYSEEYLIYIEHRYRFMGEIVGSLHSGGREMLEYLLMTKDFNNLDGYKRFVEGIDDEEFFYHFFGQYIKRDILKLALQYDMELNKLYTDNRYISTNYLALKSLFTNKGLFLQEFFSCLRDLHTEKFIGIYQDIISKINLELHNIEKSLYTMEPLELSQSIMGKTFKNRGPYEDFIFIPSYFINIKSIRYFGKDQILYYSLNNKELSQNDITRVLKIISDDTRFEILGLLSRGGAMMGKELAENLNLSTPTISHHMEKLKEAGLVNEERIKNSKFYSVNLNAIEKFISSLSISIMNIK